MDKFQFWKSLSDAFLLLAVLCAAVAVVLFFIYDIRDVIETKTGIAQKRARKQMQESMKALQESGTSENLGADAQEFEAAAPEDNVEILNERPVPGTKAVQEGTEKANAENGDTGSPSVEDLIHVVPDETGGPPRLEIDPELIAQIKEGRYDKTFAGPSAGERAHSREDDTVSGASAEEQAHGQEADTASGTSAEEQTHGQEADPVSGMQEEESAKGADNEDGGIPDNGDAGDTGASDTDGTPVPEEFPERFAKRKADSPQDSGTEDTASDRSKNAGITDRTGGRTQSPTGQTAKDNEKKTGIKKKAAQRLKFRILKPPAQETDERAGHSGPGIGKRRNGPPPTQNSDTSFVMTRIIEVRHDKRKKPAEGESSTDEL